jgi:lipid-binding SYLF domain-containing protein
MNKTILVSFLAALSSLLFIPTAQPAGKDKFHEDVQEVVGVFKQKDSSISNFFDKAYGYAVFPNVGKGGIGIGGAHGNGEVYEQGKLVGTASLSQVTVGFQLGGQVYAELIFFENKASLDRFKESKFALSAQASAVAAAEGASANAKYELGVAVFTMAKGGLMYEASVGGQKFKYKALP